MTYNKYLTAGMLDAFKAYGIDPSELYTLVELVATAERNRILTIIELDLLTSQEVKERLKALAYGGYENVPKS